ncbi:MAG: hypothetical protein QG597_1501 [Actinomycetota bacterium]|nr:hypothetical protein [Actinomycetota bacterium]
MDAVGMGTLIRQLREASGMTQTQLGERLGLRKDQVSKVEHGVRRLDIAEMAAAAEALGTTSRRLMGRPESGTLTLAARLTAGASPDGSAGGQVDAVTGRARQLLELDHLLDELGARIPPRVSDPASQVLAWARALPDSASTARANRDGQELAGRTRAALGLGSAPLGSLADLAERHFGVDVECGPFGPGVSGMCVHAGPIALILANTELTAGHLRFTLAHELAHHLLGDPREVVIEDGLGGDAVLERRANAVAAHQLMPPDELRRVVAGRAIGDEVLAELMQYFQVSLASLVNHLAGVKVIDFGQRQPLADRPARRLVNQHGDPGKDDPTREGHGVRPPLRLLASARAAHRQGRIGATIFAALLGIAVHEVASDLASDVTAGGTAVEHDQDTGHGRDAAAAPATGPDPAPRGGDPDDLVDEAAAVFADL